MAPRVSFGTKCVTGSFILLLICWESVTAYNDDFPLADDREDMLDNLNTNEETQPSRRPIDPKGSWLQFVRHSEKVNTRRQPKKKKKRNKNTVLQCPPGPPGPQGPPGPPGPPGAEMTQEKMMEEFKALVKEIAEKRAEELLSERCEACTSLLNGSYSLPPEVDQMLLVPRVTAAFHMRLRKNINVATETFLELQNFHQPFGNGAFQRGHVFNAKDGRFVAPRDGLYQFAANLHLKLRHKGSRERMRQNLRKRDFVKIQICIDSLCQKNMSLEYITGLDTNSRIFTVSVTGLLEMKSGQYASVYVDNASRMTVKIQGDSDFTGILFGV